MITLDRSFNNTIVYTTVQIKQQLGEKKINAETIHIIIKNVIELVEKVDMKGKIKREIVVKVIQNLVDDIFENEDEKKLINDMIDKQVLSNTIDLIILGTKGKININNLKKNKNLIFYGKKLFALLVSYCKRR